MILKDFIVDGHCDVLLNYWRDDNYKFSNNTDFHVDLPKLKEGNIGLEIFAACSASKGNEALKKTIKLIDKFKLLEQKTEDIELIEEYSDINKVISRNNIGVLLAIEGADGIFDLSALRIFYQLGVRLITLTWNYRNHLAEGINELKADGGVTQFGQSFIKEMNRLGIIIDVSHLTPSSFWDVIEYSNSPVVASHSNVKEICDHPRNLGDDQIKALAKKEGLIGINFYSDFLKNNNKKVESKDVIEHIRYIKDLVGIDYIGLGTDFDGIPTPPDDLSDISKIPRLVEELKKANFTRDEIEKITRENWLNIIKKVNSMSNVR